MFFESKHSLSNHYFHLLMSRELTFPLHIHFAFEYFEQICGSTEVFIGSQQYVLREGDAVLIFPLQPHSYKALEAGRVRTCIFSPDMVPSFYKANENRLPSDHRMPRVLKDELTVENLFHQKAMTYFICGEFERNRSYIKKNGYNENPLLVALLSFAEDHFCSRCLLRDAAAKLGYDYAYVSKFFKREVGLSFREYINMLRVMKSKSLLISTDRNIEEIGESCGFSSLRAFDREFREQVGMSPSRYRDLENLKQ